MPDKAFLEQSPLYRKVKTVTIAGTAGNLPKPNINMYCPTCKSNQTFSMMNEYWENYQHMNPPTSGDIYRLVYQCMHCRKFLRYFFVRVNEDHLHLIKVGQYPAWDISIEKHIEKLLSDNAEYFKKGLICESQGYGIGAFAYYRRVVEEIIGGLLEEIKDLLIDDEKDKFIEALEQTKKTIVAQEKIALVKDLLPPILRPEGMNPLSNLHSILSEGLHGLSDEDCLEYAIAIREVLLFLVNQIAASKQSSKEFTSSMRKILEKKSGKTDTSNGQ